MKCVLKYGCQEGGQCDAYNECYWSKRTLTTEQVAKRVAQPGQAPMCPGWAITCRDPEGCKSQGECGYMGSPFNNPDGSPRHSVEPHIVKVCCGRHFDCAEPSFPCTHRQNALAASAKMACADIDPKTQPANPKQAFGDKKVPLHLFPYTAIAGGCLAFLEGALKYGGDNFRVAPVEAMTYVRANESHMKAWAEGRDIDPDSGLPELWKALACIAILIDATEAGTLIDNRKYPGGYNQMASKCEAHVERLKALHADKNPVNYTIADAPK